MKTLKLICDTCGAEKVYRGATTDRVLVAIDESEWLDRAFTRTSKRMAKGTAQGRCPACHAAEYVSVVQHGSL